MIWFLRIVGVALAALQGFLAFPTEDYPLDWGTLYLVGTVALFAGIAAFASRLVNWRLAPRRNGSLLLVATLGTLTVIVVALSPYSIMAYGPMLLLLVGLAIVDPEQAGN